MLLSFLKCLCTNSSYVSQFLSQFDTCGICLKIRSLITYYAATYKNCHIFSTSVFSISHPLSVSPFVRTKQFNSPDRLTLTHIRQISVRTHSLPTVQSPSTDIQRQSRRNPSTTSAESSEVANMVASAPTFLDLSTVFIVIFSVFRFHSNIQQQFCS